MEVYVEHINLPAYVKNQMWNTLREETEEVQAIYRSAESEEHRRILTDIVHELASKYDLLMRYSGTTIYHPDLPSK